MPKAVTDVQALEGFRIHLRFEDGVQGEVDLSDLAGKGVFAIWNERESFEKVETGDGGSIRWSNDAELCPDALYIRLTGKTVEEVFEGLEAVETNA